MTMLAAVYYGPLDLRVEQREIPSIAADEMLLRVEYASICATDLRIIQGSHRKFGPGTIRVPGMRLSELSNEWASKLAAIALAIGFSSRPISAVVTAGSAGLVSTIFVRITKLLASLSMAVLRNTCESLRQPSNRAM